MLEDKNKYELIDIAKAGASLVLDGSKFNKFELIDIAKSIQDGCTMEVNNSQAMTKFELVDIAKVAQGKLIFS